MPKASPIQTSFNGGIQTPLLDGHVNAPRRDSSYVDSSNLIPLKHGPVVRRGGTKFVAPTIFSTTSYLYSFEFNDEESYILEFSEGGEFGSTMRVYRDNALVMDSANQEDIDGITDVSDPVVTISGTYDPEVYRLNRPIYISGLSEATELNDRFFRVKTHTSTSEMEIVLYNGFTSIGGLSAAETSSTGTLQIPIEVILPFCDGELFRADGSFIPKLVQSNDVLYMTHPDYAPRIIARTANDVWTVSIASLDDGPYQVNTSDVNMLSGHFNTTALAAYPNWKWNEGITTVDIASSTITTMASLGAGLDTRITIPAGHGIVTGDIVWISGVGEGSDAYAGGGSGLNFDVMNDKKFTVTADTATTIDVDFDSTTAATTGWVVGDGGTVASTAKTYAVATDAAAFARTDATYTTTILSVPTTGGTTTIRFSGVVSTDLLANGDTITISGALVMVEMNGKTFKLSNRTVGANTDFDLLDPCDDSAINSTSWTTPYTGVSATAIRGQVDRLMRIRFEDSRARTVWFWGRITKFVNSQLIEWTIDSDVKAPDYQFTLSDRKDRDKSKLFPAGPGGFRDGVYDTEKFSRGDGGTSWELGVYSDTTSFPSIVSIHQGRVVVGASDDYPRRLDFTQTGGFDTTSLNFQPTEKDGQTVDSNGISIEIGSGDGSPVQWIQSIDGALGVGSTSSTGVLEGGAAGSGATITPSNASYRQQDSSGSSSVQPLVVGKSMIHTSRLGRRLYEMTYGIESDGYSALDITELAEHLTRSGVIDIAWQQNPINTLWCVLDDGGLIAFTYERSADVLGWHTHQLGGTGVAVDSVAVIPSSDLTRDELWLSTSRTINGVAGVRYIEYMDRWYEDDMGLRAAYHMDCGKVELPGTINIGSVTNKAHTIDAATNTNPCLIDTAYADGVLVAGEYVYISDVCGMTELNGNVYKLGTVFTDSATYYRAQLLDPVTGANIDSSSFETYSASGTLYRLNDITVTRSGHTLNPSVNLNTAPAVTQALPAVVTTASAHGFITGDTVYFDSLSGMIELNDNSYKITVLSTTTFELDDVNSTLYTAHSSGGAVQRQDIIRFTGVTGMTGLNGKYFRAFAAASTTFKLQYIDGTEINNQSGDSLLYGDVSSSTGSYQACSNSFTGYNHLEGETVQVIRDGQTHPDEIVCNGTVQLGTKTVKNITGATQADPVVITSASHGFSDGDSVYIAGVQGMTELNGNCYKVAGKTTDTFQLNDFVNNTIDGTTGHTAYICDGTASVSNLDLYGANVGIGLPNTWHLQTHKLEAGSATGTAQGKTKRLEEVTMRLRETLGLKYGPDASDLQTEVFDNATTISGEPTLFTGDRKLRWNGGYETEGQMYFKGEGPYPAQIQAIMPQINTQDG